MRFFKGHSLVLPFLLFCECPSDVWADQVLLKNGDRVTGSIIKKSGNTLTIKTDQFGVVAAQWDQIESIVADKPLTIALQDGRTVQGTFASADGKIEVTTSQTKVSIAFADVAAIRNADEQKSYERLLKPRWTELWSGGGTIGVAGTSGNSKTLSYTTSFNAARLTNSDKTSLYFKSIKASSLINGENVDTARAVRGGFSYDHNISPRMFVDTFNDYEYDRFQNLDLRVAIGGGLGFNALKTARSRLDLLAGANYNHSDFSTPLTQNAAELYWGDEYALKLSSATSLTQSYRMFNNLTDTGIYRVNFDVGLDTKIWKWLSWNLSLSDRFLSDPAPGRKTNDLLYTTGIGITFGK